MTKKMKPGLVPWLAFEDAIRDALRRYRDGEELGIHALRLIDLALASATRRGHVLPEEPLAWEPTADHDPARFEAWAESVKLGWGDLQ